MNPNDQHHHGHYHHWPSSSSHTCSAIGRRESVRSPPSVVFGTDRDTRTPVRWAARGSPLPDWSPGPHLAGAATRLWPDGCVGLRWEGGSRKGSRGQEDKKGSEIRTKHAKKRVRGRGRREGQGEADGVMTRRKRRRKRRRIGAAMIDAPARPVPPPSLRGTPDCHAPGPARPARAAASGRALAASGRGEGEQ